MKARVLRKILNDTRYSLSNHNEYIAVGSPLCHDLIKVDKKTLTIKYALDTFREGGRVCLVKNQSDELLFIWDTLEKLISSGEIKDIIEGDDDITKDMFPVYHFDTMTNKVDEQYTELNKWPNTTHTGRCIYDKDHFEKLEGAINYGINHATDYIQMFQEQIADLQKQISDKKQKLQQQFDCLEQLKQQQNG